MANTRLAVPVFIVGCVLTTSVACKPARIQGKVADAQGRPLADVTAKIANTAFTATTTREGEYELDYAAGGFAVTWAKPGYTTVSRTFNVAERTSLPAETVVLFPIPEDKWLHYVSADTIYPLSSSPVRRDRKGALWEYRETAFAELAAPNVVPPGRAAFIDRDSRPLMLVRVGDDGQVADAVYGIGEVKDYHGIVEDSSFRVGAESLLVRVVWLKSGRYAWVPIKRDPGGAGHVGDFAMVVQVVDSAIAADVPTDKRGGAGVTQAGTESGPPITYNVASFGYITKGQTVTLPFHPTLGSAGCSASGDNQCDVYLVAGARPDSGVSFEKLRQHYSLNKDVAEVTFKVVDGSGRVLANSSNSGATMFGHVQDLLTKIQPGAYSIVVTGVGTSGRFSILWTRRITGH